jgi:hypothetical protein
MDEIILEAAIKTAKVAAEKTKDYKSETYGAVLLIELMKSTAATAKNRNELPAPVPSQAQRREKPYSAAEFFSAKSWATEIDKVVIAGYYLERFGGNASYTIEELRNCLVAAKIPLPKNISLAILQAAQKALMMEIPSTTGTRKSWALTQSGERWVEEMSVGRAATQGA